MSISSYVILAILGLGIFVVVAIAVFAIVFIAISFFEKQYIHKFEFADSNTFLPLPYTSAMNEALLSMEFKHDGTYQHMKGGIYKVTADLWLSADSQILAVVGGGKMLNMPYKKTFLYSRLDNGQILLTNDDFGVSDLSGIMDIEVLMNADAKELVETHSKRLMQSDNSVIPFKKSGLLQQFEQIEADETLKLIDMGLANFVNYQENVWTYTVKGALLNYWRGFRKQLTQAKAQQERINIKRPGA